jgi:hypothetical protein
MAAKFTSHMMFSVECTKEQRYNEQSNSRPTILYVSAGVADPNPDLCSWVPGSGFDQVVRGTDPAPDPSKIKQK